MANTQLASALTDEDLFSAAATAAQNRPPSGFGDAFFDRILQETRDHVDAALADWPDSLTQARARIVQQLWPEPRPEELQTIVRIATDPVAQGARSAACRELLALRLLAERERRSLWEGPLGEQEPLRRSARVLEGTIARLAEFTEEMTLAEGGMGPLGAEDLEPIHKAKKHLAPPHPPMLAGLLLAPRIAAILDAASGSDPRSELPSLTDDELRAIGFDPAQPGAAPLRRSALEVAAVRCLIHELQSAWEESTAAAAHEAAPPASEPEPAESETETDLDLAAPEAGLEPEEGREPAGQEAAVQFAGRESEHRQDRDGRAPANVPESAPAPNALFSETRRTELRRRIQDLELAYTFVGDRLQKLQDAALMARRKEEADELFRFRKPLSASHAMLAPILQHLRSQGQITLAPGAARAAALSEEESGGAVNVGDGEVDAIFQNALAETQATAAAQPLPALIEKEEKRRSFHRIARLASVAIALLIVLFLVYDLRPTPPPPPLDFSPADSIALKLTATEPIGTLLYAQVTESWDGLSESERLREIDDLSRTALNHGFFAIQLVDQHHETVAIWDREKGTRLMAPPPPEQESAAPAPHAPSTSQPGVPTHR